jgi:putative CocE/NonD family hydrolase
VVQSVRGVSGSEGRFDPMRQERVDGADTVDWLKAQPWFGGTLFTNSMSYLGNVQYAMAMDRGADISGMALGMTLSNFAEELRAGGGSLTLRGMLSWTQTMQQVASEGGRGARRRPPSLDAHFAHLPLGTIDTAAFGEPVPHWQDWMAHEDSSGAFWQAMDYSAGVTKVTAPAMMVAGWRDIFLPFQLRDFAARQAAGLETWLTIGPWQHASPGGMIAGLKDAAIGFPQIARGRPAMAGRDKVRIYVEGAKQWRDYPSWPPPGGEELRLHLCADGSLSADSGAAGVSSYTYDPGDPTPAVHGPSLMGGKRVREMAALEARRDTLCFTSSPLEVPFEAIGPVTAALTVRSNREHTDFYVCLCDVDPRGRSLQVCDGYIRLSPGQPEAEADGSRRFQIECWPTAWRFKAGHRLRVIVASGAFPRFARNLGTGEPMATAVRMVTAEQEVLHGSEARSALVLRSYTAD